MSYCRYGTDKGKSDVYIWGGMSGITICLSWGKAEELEIPQDTIWKTKRETLLEIKRLRKEYNIHIPRCASKRLRREIFLDNNHKKFLVKHYLKYRDWKMRRILSKL